MNKKIQSITVLLVLVFFFTSSAYADDWSDEWNFDYEESGGYETQGFSLYETLDFSGSANVTGVPQFTLIDTLNFSGKASVQESTVDVNTSPTTWNAGTPNCGTNVTNNFTFYQNGTATVNVSIGFNNTNYTYVNWATYDAGGHDQYTANFTNDSWATEANIEPGFPPWSNVLNASVTGNTNFTFGVRIWVPKSVSTDLREDFIVVIEVNKQ